MATEIGIKELLEAGVHFGHQTRRWNPKMRRFIHGERGGIHIIDLQKTERLLHRAQEFAGELAGRGGTILFVGTKKQARDTIREAAESCGMPYVNQRWLGGLLTNFQTIKERIKRLHELREWTQSGTMDLLPVRERIAAISERDKLETNLGGVADMQRPPDAMFVVDLKTETIGLREATREAIVKVVHDELTTMLGGLGILTIQAMPLALPGLILLLPLVLPLLVIGLVVLPFWLLYRAVRALARRVPRRIERGQVLHSRISVS